MRIFIPAPGLVAWILRLWCGDYNFFAFILVILGIGGFLASGKALVWGIATFVVFSWSNFGFLSTCQDGHIWFRYRDDCMCRKVHPILTSPPSKIQECIDDICLTWYLYESSLEAVH